MHKAAAGALQAQAVDRLGDLYLHLTGEAESLGGELVQAGMLRQVLTKHKPPIQIVDSAVCFLLTTDD